MKIAKLTGLLFLLYCINDDTDLISAFIFCMLLHNELKKEVSVKSCSAQLSLGRHRILNNSEVSGLHLILLLDLPVDKVKDILYYSFRNQWRIS